MLYQQLRSPAVYAAPQRYADMLSEDSGTVAVLTEATGYHPRLLCRILHALTCIGVFVELDRQHFAHRALSRLQQADMSESVSAIAVMNTGLMRTALMRTAFCTLAPGVCTSHDWDDPVWVRVVDICRRTMALHSRLFVTKLMITLVRSDELAYALNFVALLGLGGAE